MLTKDDLNIQRKTELKLPIMEYIHADDTYLYYIKNVYEADIQKKDYKRYTKSDDKKVIEEIHKDLTERIQMLNDYIKIDRKSVV